MAKKHFKIFIKMEEGMGRKGERALKLILVTFHILSHLILTEIL